MVAQVKAMLKEQDYTKLVLAATQAMEAVKSNENLLKAASTAKKTVQNNENMSIVAAKVQEIVQDEENREKLDKAVKMGVAQMTKASAYASESIASRATIF